MTRNTLFMETTKVSSSVSAADITKCLVRGGARSISTDYGEDGSITGIKWAMKVGLGEIHFTMPARVEIVLRKLVEHGGKPRNEKQRQQLREKAERVAWRQLLRWVEAQMAMIDCGLSEMTEVFFPYMQVAPGKTIYEVAKASQFKALPTPGAQ